MTSTNVFFSLYTDTIAKRRHKLITKICNAFYESIEDMDMLRHCRLVNEATEDSQIACAAINMDRLRHGMRTHVVPLNRSMIGTFSGSVSQLCSTLLWAAKGAGFRPVYPSPANPSSPCYAVPHYGCDIDVHIHAKINFIVKNQSMELSTRRDIMARIRANGGEFQS